jgi:uncharacterized protein (TIGR00251 family)
LEENHFDFYIEVKPNSRKNEICKSPRGGMMIRLNAVPVDGKANEALLVYLSEIFKVSESNIKIEKGSASRLKKISVFDNIEFVKSLVDNYK